MNDFSVGRLTVRKKFAAKVRAEVRELDEGSSLQVLQSNEAGARYLRWKFLDYKGMFAAV